MFLKLFFPTEQIKRSVSLTKAHKGPKHWLFVLFCSLQMKQNTVNTLCMSLSIFLFSLFWFVVPWELSFCFVVPWELWFDFVFLVNNKIEILGQDINQSTAREICLSFTETASQCLSSIPLSYQSPKHSQQAGLPQEQHGPVAVSHSFPVKMICCYTHRNKIDFSSNVLYSVFVCFGFRNYSVPYTFRIIIKIVLKTGKQIKQANDNPLSWRIYCYCRSEGVRVNSKV